MQPIFFLHVPKTGGTSVVHSLNGVLNANQVVVIPERNAHGDYLSMDDKSAWAFDNRLKLRDARFICGHYLYGMHEYVGVDPYYVTVFRDPLERMASQFRHVQASRSKDLPQHQEVRSMDFDTFMRQDWPRDSTRYHCAVKNGGICPQISGLKSPLFTSVNVRWLVGDRLLLAHFSF